MTDNTMCVHVAFSINSDKTAREIAVSISAELSNTFGNQAKCVSCEKADSEIEIIFSIQKPIMDSDEVNSEFFQKLKELFEQFKHFTPHFTN